MFRPVTIATTKPFTTQSNLFPTRGGRHAATVNASTANLCKLRTTTNEFFKLRPLEFRDNLNRWNGFSIITIFSC